MLSIEYVHKRIRIFRIELGPIVLGVLLFVLLMFEVLRVLKVVK